MREADLQELEQPAPMTRARLGVKLVGRYPWAPCALIVFVAFCSGDKSPAAIPLRVHVALSS